MSVKLRKRKNQDGTTSLILDIYNNGQRHYEFLKHLKLSKGTSEIDRQANKENLELAKRIAVKRAQELSATDYDIVTTAGKKTIVVDWMKSYLDKYQKKDKKNVKGVIYRFVGFLNENKLTGLTFGRLSEDIVIQFSDYLTNHNKGEGAASYFARYKKMLKEAQRRKLILVNPAAAVPRPKGEAEVKDVLTLEEIKLLSNTETQSDSVKRGFLFSCMTGLRFVECSTLKWGDISIQRKVMTVKQSKTGKEKTITLNDTAIKLVGDPGKKDELVFKLPTPNGSNKVLKAWVKRAGIDKYITWHCARHSAGTLLVYNGADVLTAGKILGHTTTKHTARYVRIADEMKQKATDSLNFDL